MSARTNLHFASNLDKADLVKAETIKAAIIAKPDGVLEMVANEHGVSQRFVLDCLPEGQATVVDGARFVEIWTDLTGWGEIMFIVHTKDGVFETKGSLPHGTSGRGYFNIHGDSPIGGHLKSDRCAAIYLLDRPFFGRRSCSVQFVSVDGDSMFKVFVSRDENRELKHAQLARFESLKASLSVALQDQP